MTAMIQITGVSLHEWNWGTMDVEEETFFLRIAAIRFFHKPTQDNLRELVRAANEFGEMCEELPKKEANAA